MGFGKTNVSGGNNDEKLQAHLSDKGNPHGVTAEQIGAVPISHGFLGNATSDLNTATEPGHYLWIDNAGDFGIAGHMYDLYVSNQKFGENPAIVQRMTRVYCGVDIAATFERAYYYANGVDNQAVHWTDWKRLATTDNLCNPNLLDNWYFGNPVDQRGGYVVPPGVAYGGASSGTTTKYYPVKSTYIYNDVKYAVFDVDGSERNVPFYACVRGYTGNTDEVMYTIDRWRVENNIVVTLESDGLSIENIGVIAGQFNQELPPNFAPEGSLVCISAMVKSVSGDARLLFSQSSTPFGHPVDFISLQPGFFSGSGNLMDGNHKFVVYLGAGAKVKLTVVKLELGPTQTLAHKEGERWVLNEVPNYGEQLLRCCMSMADPSDGYANNKRTPGVLGAVNRAGDTMTGALGVNNNLALLSGYTDSSSTLAQLQAVKDNLNSALLQLERPLDDKTWPNVALYQRVNGGDYTLIGRIIHTGNIENYAAKIATGTYTGDGNASMSITLPFTPKAVYVCPSHGGTLWIPEGSGNGTTYTYGGLAVTGQNAVTWRGGHDVVAIQTGGFTAYYAHYSNEFMYAAANMNGQKYNYIAFG